METIILRGCGDYYKMDYKNYNELLEQLYCWADKQFGKLNYEHMVLGCIPQSGRPSIVELMIKCHKTNKKSIS